MIRSSLYKMFTLSIISCILACNPDYHLFTPDKSNLDVDELEAPTEGSIDSDSTEDETETFEDNQVIHPNDIQPRMRLDAAIQHMGWGAQQTRCQIEVAFNRRYSPPPEEPDEESTQPEPPAEPESHGECVFTKSEIPTPEDGGTNNNGNNGPGDPNQQPGNGGQNGNDDWFISGDLSGPEVLYLHSLEQTIVLEMTRAEDGLIKYSMPDCHQETFPFGEVFDLEIPSSHGEGAVPEAYIEDILAFGPNIQIETPSGLSPMEQYQGYGEDGLYFSWSFEHNIPNMVQEERLTVQLTNNSNQPWNFQESMKCIPDTRYDMMLFGEDLLQFTLAQYLNENVFSIGLNIHGDYYGPDREDPWGNILRARVNVTRGGMMELAEQ
jgi:hypothetical protein